ncbi:MAG: hypothetical protein ACKPE1_23725, partial [Dolichospermum sp.]
MPVSSGCGYLLLAAVVAGGCDRAAEIRPGDIRTYAIPKAAEPSGQPAPAQAATAATGPSGTAAGSRPPLRYEVPDGWSDAGGSGLRLATLLIGDPADKLEVTVIPASGSLAGNVERWQGQLDPSS